MMLRGHKIEMRVNNKQATYFSKACGVARVAYNWGLSEWKRQHEAGEKPTDAALRRQLNSQQKCTPNGNHAIRRCI
jgi:putative transposase